MPVSAFTDDRRRARVCRAILSSFDLGHLWTGEGPTDHAPRLFEDDGGILSSGERVILLFAFSLWKAPTGGVDLRVSDLWKLDEERLGMVGSLLWATAGGADGVEDWLGDHE